MSLTLRWGAHVSAVSLPLSPASTPCFFLFLLYLSNPFVYIHLLFTVLLCWLINLIWFDLIWSSAEVRCHIDFQDGGRCGAILLPVSDWVSHFLQEVMSISTPNFVRITQSAAEIYQFPVSKNKRPPYWKSTSGFDFDHIAVIRMTFCINLPNFIDIGAPNAEIWRHIDFSRWRPRRFNTTSAFLFVEIFRKSKSISKPNFVDRSQFRAEI